MNAEIISIGDELLIGQITNTNSVWIAQQLTLLGIRVIHHSSIADSESAIVNAFDQALKRSSSFVFITGGLGPTKDDITKRCFADYFQSKLVMNEEVLAIVTSFFVKRGREVTELNRQQALVPEHCEVIMNYKGTAPGMWMQKQNTIFISMPGVPHEMKAMMSDSVLPAITKRFSLPAIFHKSVLTVGMGESMLAEKIENWENALEPDGIRLAYLPQPGMVRLRLSAFGGDQKTLQDKVEKHIKSLRALIPENIFATESFGEEHLSLQEVVLDLLRERQMSFSVAESCTGGYLSSLITAVPGASDVFKGGIVPYTNGAKRDLLGLDENIFQNFGAVSKECVTELARNARLKFNSDFGIGISGIAGPSGGTAEKPVGLVWIAVAGKDKLIAMKYQFGENRQINITMSAITALNMLRKLILKNTQT
ncbi:MAG TPA: competence/damage-inducible protein A [Bacteroidia bacterium]|nr:competence/damage-inducible protein A [Bacteroidia bacterium]